eukprot:jgi/Tetstr1/429104/TSEL_019066.t1
MAIFKPPKSAGILIWTIAASMRGVDWSQASKPSNENAAEMLAASTASKKGSSSDGGIMRLRKPVYRTAHTTSNRMAPWWQPYPNVPKEAMRSNSAVLASRRRPNARVNHSG